MNAPNLAQIGYENYYQMLSDNVRMQAYRKAIFKTVKVGDVVVDMGAGTGLLGIWAIQAGASRVYAIEKTSAIHLAKEIAKKNNCLHKMVFINKNSMDTELPERADVLISETMGSFGIDENTIQFTNDARERFLSANGKMIPQAIELFVAPIDDVLTYHKLDFWRHIPDIDLMPAFDLFSKKIMVESVNPNGLLANPTSVGYINLKEPIADDFASRHYINITKPGTIHGVAGWFNCTLCEGVQINTAPDSIQTHWKQAFFPFKEDVDVIKGDILDWSVSVGAKLKNSDDTKINYEYRCTQLKNELTSEINCATKSLPGRNDKCSCGSEKKFKKCCLNKQNKV